MMSQRIAKSMCKAAESRLDEIAVIRNFEINCSIVYVFLQISAFYIVIGVC